jgi:hypothetical protein
VLPLEILWGRLSRLLELLYLVQDLLGCQSCSGIHVQRPTDSRLLVITRRVQILRDIVNFVKPGTHCLTVRALKVRMAKSPAPLG